MENKKMILTVSAYGAMSDSTSRYRAVIVADTPEEVWRKLRDFFAHEVNRAKTIEDLSDSEITEILIPDDVQIPEPEVHEIISVPELGTDYHIERPWSEIINECVDDNHPSRSAYVFTSYKRGFCCEEGEFPDAMAVCFIEESPGENAERLCEETINYMAWDCQVVPVL